MNKNIEINAIFRMSNETGNAYMKNKKQREKKNTKRIDKYYLLKFKISLYIFEIQKTK